MIRNITKLKKNEEEQHVSRLSRPQVVILANPMFKKSMANFVMNLVIKIDPPSQQKGWLTYLWFKIIFMIVDETMPLVCRLVAREVHSPILNWHKYSQSPIHLYAISLGSMSLDKL
jgi:hypothetical protein